MSLKEVKLFVFDLDGTFYEQKKVKKLLIKKFILRLHQLNKYQKARKQLVGEQFDSYEDLISQTSQYMGLKNNSWIQQKFYPHFYSCFDKLSAHHLANTVLNHLHSKGIKIAVVSDYGNVEGRLISLGIDINLIDFCHGTETEGCLKPNKSIGLKIENHFNLASEQIVYIGDRVDTDKAIADVMGSKFYGITFTPNESPEFNHWEDLNELVQQTF